MRELFGVGSAVPGFFTEDLEAVATWLRRNKAVPYEFRNDGRLVSKKVLVSSLFGAPYGGVKKSGSLEIADMAAAIQSNNWLQDSPIIMHHGAILDGWRRIEALRMLNMSDVLVEVRPPAAAASGLPKAPCWDCVLKHLGQAFVLAEEACMGYEWYKVIAYGHLAEASLECPDAAISHQIRDARVLWQSMGQLPDFKTLIEGVLDAIEGVLDAKA